MLNEIDIDVMVPTCNGFDSIKKIVEKLKTQRRVNIRNIVFPMTLGEEKHDIIMKEFCQENGIIFFEVDQWYFSHSLTRQRAIKHYCKSKIVVMFSQDVKFINDNALYNLVKPIYEGECVYAYGRQIARKKTLEKYIRERNYPPRSKLVSEKDIEELQIDAFFSSDAFSAIDRDVFLKLDGYMGHDVMMCEDMIYSYNVLTHGYKKKYCSDAVVEHWHRYSLRQVYKRYYDTGKFFKDIKIFDDYKTNESGLRLAKYVLKRCFTDFYFRGVIRWLPDMLCRYVGMKKGRISK